MSPVFVHDPRRGETLQHWFSLEGNPAPDKDWGTVTLEYVDADGAAKLLEVPNTPADFALQETRFKKQFRPLAATENGVPVHEYIDIAPADRAGLMPFVYTTDDDKRLVKLAVSSTIVGLVEERRKYWRTLQYLGGHQIEALDASHRAELAHLQQQYQDSVRQRESSLDSIARAMSELAASSNAPSSNGLAAFMPSASAAPALAAPSVNGAKANGATVNGAGAPLVSIDEADQAKCTNCKTCYQDLGEVFEKTRIMVDGVAREVGRVKPGALDHLAVTPELRSRAARVAANCDAEIIR
jgi:pyruvate-ferredoxin/flavodoxin oxidoreductase